VKIGIIGCGKIADQHVEQILRIQDSDIVAVCDSEELMAKQLHERFPIKYYFHNVERFLDAVGPGGVVHITTPPMSHFALGKKCLEAGCNIYMEKPFTVNSAEAEALIRLAETRNLKITVGHNAQFTHAACRMRELVHDGYLGGPPVHMEAYYCYSLGDQAYAKALLGDSGHWVRKLPGMLLHNIISHGISKVAEFISTEHPKVIAHGFPSRLLRNIQEDNIVDELRVIIDDGNSVTAYFTFSTQMAPKLRQLRLYGTKNALVVDDDHQTLVRFQGTKYKSYLDQFIPPLQYAKEYSANSWFNVKKFLRRDFHTNHGMQILINSFYRSVREESSVPIPYREILLTATIMDDIFTQLQNRDSATKVAVK
jgi:predicted dehydrogenase